MPILIKDFLFSQTNEEVILRVPMKIGPNTKSVDIYTYENYIKINYSPFFFEAFLLHSIVETESVCTILENEIKFILKKAIESEQWETLEKSITKNEKTQWKKDMIQQKQEKLQAESAMRIEKFCQKKRDEISKEVDREGRIREEYERIHKTDFQKGMEELDSAAELKRSAIALMKSKSKVKKSVEKKPIKAICQPMVKKVQPNKVVPAIRTSASISVTFTERKFPTPQRESQEEAERQWLLKQSEAKKNIGFVEEDLRPEERNSDWLKEKGNSFFKSKNFLAAISAYTTAIRLTNSKCYDLFLNRSAVQFALGNFQRCAEDCSMAYDLLTPHIDLNAKARSQCLARRGAALCHLGMLQQGYEELLAASKLSPSDDKLKTDIEMISKKLELENCD